MTTVFVSGAAGMVGSTLTPYLQSCGYVVISTDIRTHRGGLPLDVSDRRRVFDMLDKTHPDIVVHLAAETDVDLCESNPEHAKQVNEMGTRNVAQWCATQDVKMAYVSTAGVFDGTKDQPYDELDSPNPINAYGMTKLAGERTVAREVSQYFIVRAGWMIGGAEEDKKFVAKIVRQIKDGRKVIHAVSDKFGTPTYTNDFVLCLERLLRTDLFGLYHMVNEGSGSRYDVARQILTVIERHDIELVPVASDFFRESYPAPRPRSEALRNRMLTARNMNTMRSWKAALQEYLLNSYQDLGNGVR